MVYENLSDEIVRKIGAIPVLGSAETLASHPNILIVELIITSIFGVKRHELYSKKRGAARIAHARHIAIYLAHVSLGLSFTRLGQIFGRDRTTVAHACQRIEDERENPQIDWILTLMELSIRRLTHSPQQRTVRNEPQ